MRPGARVVRKAVGSEDHVALPALVADMRRARAAHSPAAALSRCAGRPRAAPWPGPFARPMREYEYRGAFRGVYPIKVNQQRQVVEEVVSCGAEFGMGLEAGSKPELLIALALLDTPEALIICNGYKDLAYIETALLAQRLGRTPVIVIDRIQELGLVMKAAAELGIRPHLGVRARWPAGALASGLRAPATNPSLA